MKTYLYKKTHTKTQLQYLGVTTQHDPHAYSGSGKRWLNHLNKHGYDYTTEILLETSSPDELKAAGLHYSKLWNIVESDSWANIIPEAGEFVMTPEVAKKISSTMKGRPAHNKGLKQKHRPHKARSDKGKSRGPSKLKGRKRPRIDCPHCGKNIDEANYPRYHGDNCKLK